MKKKGGLGKLYDRFTPDERFRLVIEAVAREDKEETKRLVDSCPHSTYVMSELAYRNRISVSLGLTLIVCIHLAPLLAQLKMIEAFQKILSLTYRVCKDEALFAYLEGYKAGSRYTWKTAGKVDYPQEREEGAEEDEEPVIEEDLEKITSRLEKYKMRVGHELEELKRHSIKEAYTTWEAFDSFCGEELLLKPEKLVKVCFEPLLPELEKLKNTPDLPAVDPEELSEYEDLFKQTWNDLVRPD